MQNTILIITCLIQVNKERNKQNKNHSKSSSMFRLMNSSKLQKQPTLEQEKDEDDQFHYHSKSLTEVDRQKKPFQKHVVYKFKILQQQIKFLYDCYYESRKQSISTPNLKKSVRKTLGQNLMKASLVNIFGPTNLRTVTEPTKKKIRSLANALRLDKNDWQNQKLIQLNNLYPLGLTMEAYFNNLISNDDFSFKHVEDNEPFALVVARLMEAIFYELQGLSESNKQLYNILYPIIINAKIIDPIIQNYLLKIKFSSVNDANSAIVCYNIVQLMQNFQTFYKFQKIDNKLQIVYKSLVNKHFQLLQKVLLNSYAWTAREPLTIQSTIIKTPLGVARYSLFTILSQWLQLCPDLFRILTETFWDLIVRYFVEFRTNNVMNNLLCKLITDAFRQEERLINCIMIKLNLMSQMHQTFQQMKPNGIEIKQLQLQSFSLNCCRIVKELEKISENNEELSILLSSNASWTYFVKVFKVPWVFQSRRPTAHNKTRSEGGDVFMNGNFDPRRIVRTSGTAQSQFRIRSQNNVSQERISNKSQISITRQLDYMPSDSKSRDGNFRQSSAMNLRKKTIKL